MVVLVTGLLPTQSTVQAVSSGHDSITTALGHLAAYTLLGFLLGGAVAGWEPDAKRLLPAWVAAVALGGLVELLQGPLPYRDAQALDVAVNAAGAAVGLVVFSVAARATRSRSHPG
jgi:VanZ family protein